MLDKLARLRIRFQHRMFPLSCWPRVCIEGFREVCTLRQVHFRGMKFSRHLIFTVQPKYYILQHFNLTVWPEYYNLRHFSFAVVLKIEFSMCVSFQLFMNFGKNMAPKCKLKYIFIFFYIPVIHKSIKSTRITSALFKDTVIFIMWVYRLTVIK